MSKITAANFKQIFTATSRASDPEVEWALDAGLVLLEEYVGEAALQDYAASNPTDAKRANALKMAHAHLSYGELGLNVGSRLREGGIILSETDDGGDKTQYLPPEEVEKFVQQHEAKALKFLRVYRIAESINHGGVEFSHPAATGCEFC